MGAYPHASNMPGAAMLLSPPEAEHFFALHRSFMCFVNERLQVAPHVGGPDDFANLPPETQAEIRNAWVNQPELIESFVNENPRGFNPDDLEIVSSWRHFVAERFFVFRYLKKYAVFLKDEDPPKAYGVTALTQPLENLLGPYLPVWTYTVLLPFQGKIVYDGLLSTYNISFGGGVRRRLNETYREAKEKLGIVTSLPINARPMAEARPKKRTKPKAASKDEIREARDAIVGMVDDFCRTHLNEEYAQLCGELTEKLARKRPSPLLSGRPETWACGIVRTIGWVNFLDDRSTQPHLRLPAIDEAFGVAQSTGQAKSAQIRKMLKIRQLDPRWTLPSLMDDNPLIWMLEVNGFIMDIRQCPRQLQEMAYQKGLIPYIPADREAVRNVSVTSNRTTASASRGDNQ
jgi:hypothetical protein